jgi:hypothetical protein
MAGREQVGGGFPTAHLVGGPLDGKEVEVVGHDFRHKYVGRNGTYEVRYLWDAKNKEAIVGRFDGYYKNSRRVDKLGRFLPKRRAK